VYDLPDFGIPPLSAFDSERRTMRFLTSSGAFVHCDVMWTSKRDAGKVTVLRIPPSSAPAQYLHRHLNSVETAPVSDVTTVSSRLTWSREAARFRPRAILAKLNYSLAVASPSGRQLLVALVQEMSGVAHSCAAARGCARGKGVRGGRGLRLATLGCASARSASRPGRAFPSGE
jgi:hypothetical protein